MQTTQTTVTTEIVGLAPIIFHSGKLRAKQNLSYYTEEYLGDVRRLKEKSDAADTMRANIQWARGIYHTEPMRLIVNCDDCSVAIQGGGLVCVEGEMVEKLLHLAAGTKRAAFKAGVRCTGLFPLLVDGKPVTVEAAFANDEYFLTKSTLLARNNFRHTWPRFPRWSATVEIKLQPTHITAAAVRSALEAGGATLGVGDWRPRYGRFVLGKVTEN